MLDQRISFLLDKLNVNDQFKILSFLYEIRKQGNIKLNLLKQLNNYFGYCCSSLWMVNDDYSLSNPIGVNMSTNLLQDYAKEYYIYDSVYPKNMNRDVLVRTTLMNCDDYIINESRNPYLSALKNFNIHHKHALLLRSNGKIFASIALFSQSNNEKNKCMLEPSLLELLEPLISKELEIYNLNIQGEKVSSNLKMALNTLETGVIVFETTHAITVLYYNNICAQYCHDFITAKDTAEKNIHKLITSVIAPYCYNVSEFLDISIMLNPPYGGSYNVRIVKNESTVQRTYIVYINPLKKDNIVPEAEHSNQLYSILTPKEHEITMMICQGLTNQQIADRLFISLCTVKTHIQHIFEKTNTGNRTSLIAMLNSEISRM